MKTIEERLRLIEERNLRVEREKAWETSNFRRFCLVIITYLLMSVIFYSIGSLSPLKSAVVPTCGYFLSTLSLSLIKEWWLKISE